MGNSACLHGSLGLYSGGEKSSCWLGRRQSPLLSRLVMDVRGQAEDRAAFFFRLEATELHFKVNRQKEGALTETL